MLNFRSNETRSISFGLSRRFPIFSRSIESSQSFDYSSNSSPSVQSTRFVRHLSLKHSFNPLLSSDDFSVEHAVADLVEGLELDRTNAQLWCLYLEFSSWHMLSGELHHLCSAALKNAQSYDLFWTVRKRISSKIIPISVDFLPLCK